MKKIALLLASVILIWGCTNDTPSGPNPDDFDRQAVLVNWADNIIIPSFTSFSDAANTLHSDAMAFSQAPTQENLDTLRESWKSAYHSFQHVSMFEMGKPMELRYRDNLNIYPTDTSEIEENIQEGTYNLELPSLNNSQGFPALDYLLYGLAETDSQLLSYYTSNSNAEGYLSYLTDLTQRISSLTAEVLNSWNSGYRDEFVSNTGNGANSSLDMIVNDYIYYYEKHLRAGKVGIPAGVFSGSPLSTHTEAYYNGELSKELLLTSLNATQNFFNGKHFGEEETGESLRSYLEYLETMRDDSNLASIINNQFDAARNQAELLNADISAQIESDNTLVLSTYDELQMNVVYMKVDMLQALNISVDYVDADGD